MPGFFVSRIVLLSQGALTRLPAAGVATLRGVIPAESAPRAPCPAEAAGPPGTAPAIDAPQPASTAPTWTPRNAVGPTWTTVEPLPVRIFCAIPAAFAIGIANAAFEAAPRTLNRRGPDAAVIIPTTRPP